MGVQDWFTKEIEKLAMLITKLLSFIKKGDIAKAQEAISEFYSGYLKKDPAIFKAIDEDSFRLHLEASQLKRPYVEALAEVLEQQGHIAGLMNDYQSAMDYYRKSVACFEYISKTYKEYSFERENRLKLIRLKMADIEELM